MAAEYTVAIAGATGVVGGTVRAILEERGFPVGELRLLASARSAGRKLEFNGAEIEVQELGPGSFNGVDLVFFAAGGAAALDSMPWPRRESTSADPRGTSAGAGGIDVSGTTADARTGGGSGFSRKAATPILGAPPPSSGGRP